MRYNYSPTLGSFCEYGTPSHGLQQRVKTDDVFGLSCSNTDIFARLEPGIKKAIGTKDLVIVTDGVSGAGKLYTLINGPHTLGPSVADLVDDWRTKPLPPGWIRSVQFDAKEFRNESTQSSGKVAYLRSKLTADGVELGCRDRGRDLLQQNFAKRTVRETKNNPSSLRGHFFFVFTLIQSQPGSRESTFKVCLLDLAGAEGRDDCGNYSEFQWINTSRIGIQADFIKMKRDAP